MDEGSPQMPTSRQIQDDLQTAGPGDVVFLNPPHDNEKGSSPDLERVVKDSANLVNASQYLKDKQDNEFPKVISVVNHYIEELKSSLSSDR